MSVTTIEATAPASPKLITLPCAADAPADGPFSVSYMAYESDSGWAIELARPSHLTDAEPTRPLAKDLPADVRAVLRAWLDAAE